MIPSFEIKGQLLVFQVRKKTYIKSSKAIVFLTDKPISRQYWDSIWSNKVLNVQQKPGNRLFARITTHFLPDRSNTILEAGCGDATYVRMLNRLGYKCIGIDISQATIDRLHNMYSDLELYCRDVRDTKFAAAQFNGYWSIGLIEHFKDGYGLVIEEAHRILKSNGILFLAFPYMSPLRLLNVLLRMYPSIQSLNEYCANHFNQFALLKSRVIDEVLHKGFKYLVSYSYNGILGWIEDMFFLVPTMKQIYVCDRHFIKPLRYVLNWILSKIMSHSILLVFRKKK